MVPSSYQKETCEENIVLFVKFFVQPERTGASAHRPPGSVFSSQLISQRVNICYINWKTEIYNVSDCFSSEKNT